MIAVAMAANTQATPAMTRASAVNAKASERAVTATAMAATLSVSNPGGDPGDQDRAADAPAAPDEQRHLVPDLRQPLAAYGWHAVLVKYLAVRSAQDVQALLVELGYAARDCCAAGQQPVGEDRGQGDDHHGRDHV